MGVLGETAIHQSIYYLLSIHSHYTVTGTCYHWLSIYNHWLDQSIYLLSLAITGCLFLSRYPILVGFFSPAAKRLLLVATITYYWLRLVLLGTLSPCCHAKRLLMVATSLAWLIVPLPLLFLLLSTPLPQERKYIFYSANIYIYYSIRRLSIYFYFTARSRQGWIKEVSIYVVKARR